MAFGPCVGKSVTKEATSYCLGLGLQFGDGLVGGFDLSLVLGFSFLHQGHALRSS